MVAINRVFKTIKSVERWNGKKYVNFKENSKLFKQYNITSIQSNPSSSGTGKDLIVYYENANKEAKHLSLYSDKAIQGKNIFQGNGTFRERFQQLLKKLENDMAIERKEHPFNYTPEPQTIINHMG